MKAKLTYSYKHKDGRVIRFKTLRECLEYQHEQLKKGKSK